ncbi:MAG: PAS domain S-box protein [Elusimicrobia bacterium]|nr:PAS domain S-box protein [Elusimicrobiota bacterium]
MKRPTPPAHCRSQGRLQALLRNSQEGALIVNRRGIILCHSPSLRRRLGYSHADVLGRSIWSFIDLKESPEMPEAFRKIAQAPGASARRELRIRQKDGSARIVEGVAVNLLANPNVRGIVINYRDVTEQRRAQEALRRREAQLRTIFESMPFEVFALGPDGRYIIQNTAARSYWKDIIGKRPEEIRPKPPADVLDLWRENNRQAFAGKRVSGEARIATKAGTRWIHNIIAPIRNEGRIDGIIGINFDVTSRKQAEEALRRSQALLAQAELLAGVGSVDIDIKAGVVHRSEGIYRIFGLGSGAMPPKPEAFLKHLHPDDRQRVRSALREAIRETRAFNEDYRIVRPDGSERIVHAEGETVMDGRGRPIRFFAWLQDITERRKLEEKLLSISDRERRNVGHDLHDDLGQQLTGIAWLGRALQERLSSRGLPEARELAALVAHVDQALARVRELALGMQSVPARPEGLREALAGLAAHVRSTSWVRCRLVVDRESLIHDPEIANHFYRIAQEAVHNALRHGRPRRIDIGLARDSREVALCIADDGCGMANAARGHSGMGLDIMRHRASLIHGTLAVASRPGQGTRIVCRVPATSGRPAGPSRPGTPGRPGPRRG